MPGTPRSEEILQQIEDYLNADDVDGSELAAILRELHHEDHRQDGVFGFLAQLLTVAGQAAERIEPDRDGETDPPKPQCWRTRLLPLL
ncbi:hypothetical protein OHT68_00415 [Streptomyces canus]|uniref:hypothetical protein n=1 Tax=Streptomyces canus TaxID=58343 RepID=UPI002E2DEE3E|nr:hypothetical protein [Streptomyces canus]